MLYCPSCKGEFRAGFTRCEACDCELVPAEDPQLADPYESAREMAAMLDGRPVVPVFTGSPEAIAELRDACARARIPVAVAHTPESCGPCRPSLTLVTSPDLVDGAIDFFSSHFEPDLGTSDIRIFEHGKGDEDETGGAGAGCPACGSTGMPASDGTCSECGLFLGE